MASIQDEFVDLGLSADDAEWMAGFYRKDADPMWGNLVWDGERHGDGWSRFVRCRRELVNRAIEKGYLHRTEAQS